MQFWSKFTHSFCKLDHFRAAEKNVSIIKQAILDKDLMSIISPHDQLFQLILEKHGVI